MEYLSERKQIIEACLWLEAKGLVIGTWGNVSVRLSETELLLTPSRVAYGVMKPEDLVVISYAGDKLSGDREPTSEMHVHRMIYIKRPDVNAVVHCHPVYSSALCASGEGIPPILEELCQLIGGGVPITGRYIDAASHIELAEETVKALGNRNAVLLRNHAPVCCGRNLDEALVCCQVVEKAARCHIALWSGFEEHVIPDMHVESERKRFLYSYAKMI